jgi:cleavage and polyadenylation specificity factor subunit 1
VDWVRATYSPHHTPLINGNDRRLKEYKDTTKLIFVTLDLSAQSYPIITSVEGLPYDCVSLLPCSTSLGGVVVIAGNCFIYVDQSSRRVVLPVNGWMERVSDLPLPQLRGEDTTRNLTLEGCRSVFVDDKTFFIVLKDGTIYPVEIIADGKTVSKLTMASALAQTTIPSTVMKLEGDHLFVASSVGPSVMLRTAHVEEEIEGDVDMGLSPAAVVSASSNMILDDDDDDGNLYLSSLCRTHQHA